MPHPHWEIAGPDRAYTVDEVAELIDRHHGEGDAWLAAGPATPDFEAVFLRLAEASGYRAHAFRLTPPAGAAFLALLLEAAVPWEEIRAALDGTGFRPAKAEDGAGEDARCILLGDDPDGLEARLAELLRLAEAHDN